MTDITCLLLAGQMTDHKHSAMDEEKTRALDDPVHMVRSGEQTLLYPSSASISNVESCSSNEGFIHESHRALLLSAVVGRVEVQLSPNRAGLSRGRTFEKCEGRGDSQHSQ